MEDIPRGIRERTHHCSHGGDQLRTSFFSLFLLSAPSPTNEKRTRQSQNYFCLSGNIIVLAI